MTTEEIHNIWLHMSGKAEGLLEAGGSADFPALFANAILEYNKREWQGLTDEEKNAITWGNDIYKILELAEAKLKEKNT